MNRRIIGYQLANKINNWLESITDKELREFLADKVIVTGGCIMSMLTGEKVNDFDVYFTTKEATLRVAEYYVALFKKNHPKLTRDIIVVDGDKVKEGQYVQYGLTKDRVAIIVKSDGVAGNDKDISDPENIAEDEETKDAAEKEKEKKTEDEEAKKYVPRYLTSNAITLSGRVQLVIRFYGDADKIHENFDYLHCTNYWTSADKTLHLKEKALEAILTKELIYVGSRYPLCSIIRMRKFIKRGWAINAGQILKMCYQLSELDLNNVGVLADQLVGVDTTYFSKLISDMQEKKAKDSEFEINYGYLVTLIDEAFDG